MADKEPSEADFEAELAKIDAQIREGKAPEAVVEEEPEQPEVEAEEAVEPEPVADPEEARAKADGHVPYEDWVAAGKDPRAWRPAAEFNRRGDMLKTPKPELIDRMEVITRRQEEAAQLLASQIRMAKEAEDRAFLRGREEAIAEAKAEEERAFNLGDRQTMLEAQALQRKAEGEIAARAQPKYQVDSEFESWKQSNDWVKNGFNPDGTPKTPATKALLVFQRDYLMANPNASLIESARHAEREVKEIMPDFFKPKTPQARVSTPSVDTGQRVVKPTNDPLSKYAPAERDLIKQAAKAFGKPVSEYIKMIEG